MKNLPEVHAIVPGEGTFYANFQKEEDARRMAETWNLRVRPFYLVLKTIDPATKTAMDYEAKTDGWSVWNA